MTILESSRRPFRHPVPAEAVPYFCHPVEGHGYHVPAWGRDARLYACNGHVAVRFFNFPADMAPGPQTVVDRLQRLSWHDGRHEDRTAWRKTDDCTLDLFRDGLFEPWEVDEETGRVRYAVDPPARVNHGLLVPLVALQLVSRLPACEIYTAGGRYKPLAFRFRGGEGIIALLSHAQEDAMSPAVCHVFAGRME